MCVGGGMPGGGGGESKRYISRLTKKTAFFLHKHKEPDNTITTIMDFFLLHIHRHVKVYVKVSKSAAGVRSAVFGKIHKLQLIHPATLPGLKANFVIRVSCRTGELPQPILSSF